MRAITDPIGINILREHFIPDHVLIYIAKGAIRMFDGTKSYVAKAGDVFIARKNRLAKYEILEGENDFEPVLFCFDERFLKGFQKKHSPPREDFRRADAFIGIKKNSLINSFIESTKPYYKGIMALDEDFEAIKHEELLIILLKNQPELSSFLFDFAPPEKIGLEAFMNQNYAFNVGIEQFAILTGRSLSSFKRDFKEIFNEPPSKWLVQKRLQEAYILLGRRNRRIADIYLDLGFKSLSHFSVAFKRQYGINPGKLAKQSTTSI